MPFLRGAPGTGLYGLAVLLLLAPAGLAGEKGNAAAPWAGEPPEAVSQAVREAVADRWSVDPSLVVLEWRPGREPLPETPGQVGLLGSGAGGEWVVEVTGSGGLQRRGIRAGVREERWVATRALPRGHTLEEGDLTPGEAVRWGPPRNGAEPPRVGWEVRRAIRPGEEAAPPAVAPPALVVVGNAVEVQVRRGRVTLRLEGEARSSGGLNDEVRVRLSTGRTVSGQVREGPVVEVVRGFQGEGRR